MFLGSAGLCGIGVNKVVWIAASQRPPDPLTPAAPAAAAAAAPVAPKAPKGIFQRGARSFFKKAAAAEQELALRQQKEKQLATDRAKLQQAKAEQAERRRQR